MIKTVLMAALASGGFAGTVQSAAYQYSYQGQDFTASEFGPFPGWTGNLIFNADLVAGGTLEGAEFSFLSELVGTGCLNNESVCFKNSYTLNSSAGTFGDSLIVSSFAPRGTWWEWAGLVDYNGIFEEFFGFNVFQSTYKLTLDKERNVVAWSGNAFQGGSNDPIGFGNINSGIGFDSREFPDGVSEGLGAWTVTPVPLPAGLPLLLAGVGALGFIARRKPVSGHTSAMVNE